MTLYEFLWRIAFAVMVWVLLLGVLSLIIGLVFVSCGSSHAQSPVQGTRVHVAR